MAVVSAARVIGPDVTVAVETRDVVLTRWTEHRTAVAAIVDFLMASGVRSVDLAGIMRDDRKLPALAGIGLSTAPSVFPLLETHGLELPIATTCISLPRTITSLYVGRYVLRMDAAIL